MKSSSMSALGSRLIGLSVGSAAVVVLAALLSRLFDRGSAARIGLALVQAAATGVVIVVTVRSIGRLDELQRRIQLEALAIAFAGTGVLATGYGFLVNAGLPEIEWGAWVWPAMAGLWAAGLVVVSRRYR